MKRRTVASWRYQHLAYSQQLDDKCMDAAARCAMDCRVEGASFVERYFPDGIVEAFADMHQAAPNCYVPMAGVLVWSYTEYQTVTDLIGRFR